MVLAGAAVASVFGLDDLCLRGLVFMPLPTVLNQTLFGSPGTLLRVKLLPDFLARNDIAGNGGGAVVPVGGVRSPIIMVTAV